MVKIRRGTTDGVILDSYEVLTTFGGFLYTGFSSDS